MRRSRQTHGHKAVCTIICLLTVLLYFPVSPGSGRAATPKTPEKESSESRIVRKIEEGERKFLYPLGDDGYLYPVLVCEAVFIESMPMKITVKLLNQQRTAAVPVSRLQEHPSCLKDMTLEVRGEKQWEAVEGGHRFQQQYLGKRNGEAFWRVLSDERVRIRLHSGGKE